MFEMNSVAVRCTSVSTNSENQGNSGETKLGMSIYVEFLASNEELDKFDAALRPAFYKAAANGQQEDLTGHLPLPKFKLAKPICWPYVGAGYGATIHPEFDVNEPFEIEDVKVDKFQFAINDEGIVGYKFRLYFHPHLDDVGPLCALERHEIKLTLTPPAVSQSVQEPEEQSPQDELFGDNGESSAETDVLYKRACAAVIATGNPTASALQTELKIGFNHAAQLLAQMEADGVIFKDDDSGEWVVNESNAAA